MNRNMFMALREDSVILRDAFCLMEVAGRTIVGGTPDKPTGPSAREESELRKFGPKKSGWAEVDPRRQAKLKHLKARIETPITGKGPGGVIHVDPKGAAELPKARTAGVFPEHLQAELDAGGYTNIRHVASNLPSNITKYAKEFGHKVGSVSPRTIGEIGIGGLAAGAAGVAWGAKQASGAFKGIVKKEMKNAVKKGITNHPISKHLGKYGHYYVPALGAAAVYGLTKDNN